MRRGQSPKSSEVSDPGQCRLFNSGIVRKAASTGGASLTTTFVTEPSAAIEVEGTTLTLGGFHQFICGNIDIAAAANVTTLRQLCPSKQPAGSAD